jgi:hypothetical protein
MSQRLLLIQNGTQVCITLDNVGTPLTHIDVIINGQRIEVYDLKYGRDGSARICVSTAAPSGRMRVEAEGPSGWTSGAVRF